MRAGGRHGGRRDEPRRVVVRHRDHADERDRVGAVAWLGPRVGDVDAAGLRVVVDRGFGEGDGRGVRQHLGGRAPARPAVGRDEEVDPGTRRARVEEVGRVAPLLDRVDLVAGPPDDVGGAAADVAAARVREDLLRAPRGGPRRRDDRAGARRALRPLQPSCQSVPTAAAAMFGEPPAGLTATAGPTCASGDSPSTFTAGPVARRVGQRDAAPASAAVARRSRMIGRRRMPCRSRAGSHAGPRVARAVVLPRLPSASA